MENPVIIVLFFIFLLLASPFLVLMGYIIINYIELYYLKLKNKIKYLYIHWYLIPKIKRIHPDIKEIFEKIEEDT